LIVMWAGGVGLVDGGRAALGKGVDRVDVELTG